MVFSSLVFLFAFLPLTLLLYFLPFGRTYKNACLFVLSLLFYSWGEPIYVLLMLGSITVNYAAGLRIAKLADRDRARKIALVLTVVFNLGLLGFFKYAGFAVDIFNGIFGTACARPDLPLPIGISFYTFQMLTYIIDVYRKDAEAQRNYIKLGAYITMFPQLIAGPIVLYSEIERQLTERRETLEGVAEGIRIFIRGLAKKVLIANSCGLIADAILGDLAGANTLAAWVAIIAYTAQIFFDFSGYSTMAIGLGRMLGFTFPENFNYPYISCSVAEFWRRWHITLGRFFRDYLYIPLGGNRVSSARWLLNIFIVWFATGLWHGASFNFVLWGLYYAVLLVLEKYVLSKLWKRIPKFFGFLFTITATILGRVLFKTETLADAGQMYLSLFAQGDGMRNLFSYGVVPYLPYLVVAALFSTPLPKRLFEWMRTKTPLSALLDLSLAALFILSVAALTGESFNPFIYFRF